MTSTDIHNLLFIFADKASDAINPVLMAFVAEEPLRLRELNRSRKNVPNLWPDTFRFWGRTLLAVGAAVVLAELGKKMQVWPGHGNFPSGHTTFAASTATCLVLRRGRPTLWLVVPLVALMGGSLLYGHWHTVDEVAAALFLGPSIAFCVWQITGRRRPNEPKPPT